MNVRLTLTQKTKILNSDDIYKIMQQVLLRENKIRRNQEHFWVVGLDNKNKVLFIELIGLGAVNRVNADPPDIFRMAIYKLAVKLILVHNHPSGEVSPSRSDLDFTDKIIKVGRLLNVEVIDHLIISEKAFLSLADEGEIDRLQKSGKFEIVDAAKAELKEWKLQIERERGEKNKAIEVGKKMKAEGFDEQMIKKMTGCI
ncbi:JAB domain-containing protein [bacterium SCSIO 12741]|nr:JAB domain-containing protein [bacterium SCSIO 12741]